MKKILLGFLLIVALIAVSYYGASRNDSRARKEFKDGYDKGVREAAVQKSRADSLETALRHERGQFADSLKIVALTQSAVVDSLNQTIASKDKELTAAKSDLRKASSRKSNTNSTRHANGSKSGVTHAQILEYYRKKLSELPADLSTYERSLAVTEIRDQTTRKYSISAEDFQKIREENRLTE